MRHATRILLTGHTGFIGRHVLDILCRKALHQDEIYCLGRKSQAEKKLPSGGVLKYVQSDIRDRVAVATALASIRRLTHVVHLAAISTQDADPVETLAVNLQGTINLADFISEYVRFVFVSSAAVFGDSLANAPHEDAPHAPTTVYGWSKSLAEQYLARTSKKLVVVRPIAQVGPGATHGLLKDVVAKLRGPDTHLELRGDHPGSAKPFAYVKHTAQSIADITLASARRAYHLSPDDCLSVARVAAIAADELGIQKPVRWLGRAATYKGDQKVVTLRPTESVYCQFPPSEDAIRMAIPK